MTIDCTASKMTRGIQSSQSDLTMNHGKVTGSGGLRFLNYGVYFGTGKLNIQNSELTGDFSLDATSLAADCVLNLTDLSGEREPQPVRKRHVQGCVRFERLLLSGSLSAVYGSMTSKLAGDLLRRRLGAAVYGSVTSAGEAGGRSLFGNGLLRENSGGAEAVPPSLQVEYGKRGAGLCPTHAASLRLNLDIRRPVV